MKRSVDMVSAQDLARLPRRKGLAEVPLRTLAAVHCSGRLWAVSLAEVDGQETGRTELRAGESFALAWRILLLGIRLSTQELTRWFRPLS